MTRLVSTLLLLAACIPPSLAAGDEPLPSAAGQLPRRMHVTMDDLPRVTVGQENADIIGRDHRALQAAVEYIAAMGGGTVQIGPGTYIMRDSLHLRPNVRIQGTPGATVLRKADAAQSPLLLDGDYGEEQVTLASPADFHVGDGIAIWDSQSGGFHTTVARITGRLQGTFSIDKPLNADCMVHNGARAATVFPVISGYDAPGAVVEHVEVDGNRENNIYLNGCRGAGIFLYRCHGAVVRHCTARNYHGDGISFQQSNDVAIEDCTSTENSSLGFHPGSGSQRPTVRRCLARGNGDDGLFLCWRVKFGTFEENLLENNGRFGISIGHKDTDNYFRGNRIRGNAQAGVYFRNESAAMAGHRNRFESNTIENNGVEEPAPGVVVDGATRDLEFRGNVIRDTRSPSQRRQLVGIRIKPGVEGIVLENNQIEAAIAVDDARSGVEP